MSNIVLCKLTDQNLRTYGGFQWELNVPPPKLSGVGGLCSGGYYHCYEHPLLAVLLNPIHADIENPRGFYIDVEGEAETEFGLRRCYPFMVLREEFTLPEITLNQRIAFGILCAMEVCDDVAFRNWAERWLPGEDRTVESSEAAAKAAAKAAKAAWAATWAAKTVKAVEISEAVWAASWTAAQKAVESARVTEIWVAHVAGVAARAAALAAAYTDTSIDLIALAERALTYN